MNIKSIKTLTLVATVALITLLGACKKSTYNQLTEDDMSWLAYKNNEILKFVNDSGDVMNYYITLRTKAYRRDGDTYNEFTTADVLQLYDTTAYFAEDSYGGMFISRSETGLTASFSWPHFALKGLPLTSLTPSVETIGGIIYQDVYTVDGSAFTDVRNYNSVIWVSKTKGVLQVEDVTGNIWVRDF